MKVKRDDLTVGMMVTLNNGKGAIGNGSKCRITKIDTGKSMVKLKARWMAGKSYWFDFNQIKLDGGPLNLSKEVRKVLAKDVLPDAPSSHKSERFVGYIMNKFDAELTIMVLTGKDIENENPIIYGAGYDILVLPALYEKSRRRYIKNAKITPNARKTGQIIYV